VNIFPRVIALATVLVAFDSLSANQANDSSCVVVQELSADKPHHVRGNGCWSRLSPASTFKIPHALVALQTGVVTIDTVEKWNGRRYDAQPKWNQDHTIVTSLRPSVLWFFQRIAPRVGASRIGEWLDKFEYGNRDTSGPVTEYWINGRLAISPVEQVAFLRRFYQGELPVATQYIRAVRDGLQQHRGTIENARGVHRLDGDWRNATLNAKTGATTTPDYRVSWLVGLLDVSGRQHLFASAVSRKDGEVDALAATRQAIRTFIDLQLLH
jgi:beta-lactamase class D